MKIIWSKTSQITLNEIINYIESDFGYLAAEKYYFTVLETVENIGLNPNLFPLFNINEEIRRAVVKKKTVLYYKVFNNNITLLAFYDVRKGEHKL